MPLPPSRAYTCEECGKQYASEWHLDSHLRDCLPSKRTLSDLLSETKEFWESRKRRRIELQTAAQDRAPSPEQVIDTIEADDPSIHQPIAMRRQGRVPRLPARYIQSASPEPPPLRNNAQLNREPGNEQYSENSGDQALPTTAVATETSASFSKRDRFGVMKTFTLVRHSIRNEQSGHTVDAIEKHGPDDLRDSSPSPQTYGPFPNRTTFALADWYWNSNNKSLRDFRKLIGIIKHGDFSTEDAGSANWPLIFKELGANKQDLPEDRGTWITDDGWRTAPVHIDVPFHNSLKGKGTESYHAGQLHYRSIVSIIRETLLDPTRAPHLQFHPYCATWKPTEDYPDTQLYGELYTSAEFQKAYDDVQRLPPTIQNAGLERVVIGLMFASDATHLTDFGTASLWPCYMFLGNESKYQRCRPNERSSYHIAYFEFLSDSITDYLHKRNHGRLPAETLVTVLKHCQREVFHRQWSMLLEGELMDAMLNGLVITCLDGKRRCFYPRIMTYSADYPEKCLIACTRKLGSNPCHRCLVKKTKEAQSTLGSPADTERLKMRDESSQNASIDAALADISNGYAINSQVVEQKLFPESLQPTKSAFAPLLSAFNFRISTALVVDELHEFEIGVWKRILIHLIRLLIAAQQQTSLFNLKDELDRRYRLTPTFGRDTIRKFSTNTSDMKRKTGRDLEDVLQCAIPAFSSLLPEEHDPDLLKLLYICAEWHALAKLRMHNEFTVRLLEHTTTLFGAQVRHFHQHTCSSFDTCELEKETNARRKTAERQNTGPKPSRRVDFDVYTIKFHFLGDYASTIRQFGTTDSYSTVTGELSHCLPKSWYPRTNKKTFRAQMSQIERRQARLAKIGEMLGDHPPLEELQDLDGRESPGLRVFVGANQNSPVHLASMVPRDDIDVHQSPYLQDFVAKLKKHLLPRIIQELGFGTYVDHIASGDWVKISLQDDRFFQHRIMRIDFDMYDTRTGRDIIHIESPQRSVMLLNSRYNAESRSTEHPYRYFDVLGILHANVAFIGTLPDGSRRYSRHRLEFLWVRRYDVEPGRPYQLDRVKLRALDQPDALGFIDPADVLRAVHLIPCFHEGLMQEAAMHPWRNRSAEPTQLWKFYHINKFVDRDMFMRYQWGMSVGHRYMYPGFPPPQIPIIGPDFDHCLNVPTPNETRNPSNSAEEERELEPEEEDRGDREIRAHEDGDELDELNDREFAVYSEMYATNAHIP